MRAPWQFIILGPLMMIRRVFFVSLQVVGGCPEGADRPAGSGARRRRVPMQH